MRASALLTGWIVWRLAAAVCAADTPAPADDHFQRRVLPLLQQHCYACHSHHAKKQIGGELFLDSRAAMLAGGESGPALVPGKPGDSLFIQAVRHEGDHKMPPGGLKLSPEIIATLEDWVKQGAVWPKSAETPDPAPRRITREFTPAERQWWAMQPVQVVEPPTLKQPWSAHPVDRFIGEKLERAGLTPSPEASRRVLARRLTFDLTGLPPTPAEIAAFENDRSPRAYENLVDRLLASPRYGERQARWWLDLVRYADSDGYRIDGFRPDAWRYRDYVVAAFNADKPYDLFVQEQLAGDELFPDDPQALVATGYLRHWIYEYNARDAHGQWQTILNDVTDTTADAFLGLGLQCARCHDHKFDPLLQQDYLRLQAFFAPLLPRDDLVVATADQQREQQAKLAKWEAATASVRKEIAAIEDVYRTKARSGAIGKFPDDVRAMMTKPLDRRTPYEHQVAELAWRQVTYEYDRLDGAIKSPDEERLAALRKRLAEFDALKPAPFPVAFAATDVGPQAPPLLHPKRKDVAIAPGFLTILDPEPAEIAPLKHSTGRRSALATWLTRPENPLTARVLVNRVWQQHFGRGLAANASDFGKLGGPPSHPELLDWLAARFVANGWSIKKLHRAIVTSATYRQAVGAGTPDDDAPDASKTQIRGDRERLYGSGRVRRLDAEQIRDALFAVTGELTHLDGGPGVAATEPRRSIQVKILRNTRDPLLEAFDAPLFIQSASSRDTTTTPVQSLLLVNSPFLLSRAKAFAARVEREASEAERGASSGENDRVQTRILRAYQLAFGRFPTDDELAASVAFLNSQRERFTGKAAANAGSAAFVDFCHALLNANEFLYVE